MKSFAVKSVRAASPVARRRFSKANLRTSLIAKPTAPLGPGDSGKHIVIHATCAQETIVQKGNSSSTWTLNAKIAFRVPQPAAGQRSHVEACPYCGRKLTLNVKSYDLAREEWKKFARVAVIGIPLFLVYVLVVAVLCYIYSDAKISGGCAAAWGALMVTGIWCLIGLGSLPYMFSSIRMKRITAKDCVSFSDAAWSNQEIIWREERLLMPTSDCAAFTIKHNLKSEETTDAE